MSTVPLSMAKEAASKETSSLNSGRGAEPVKKLSGPAKKGGKQGNKGKAFR